MAEEIDVEVGVSESSENLIQRTEGGTVVALARRLEDREFVPTFDQACQLLEWASDLAGAEDPLDGDDHTLPQLVEPNDLFPKGLDNDGFGALTVASKMLERMKGRDEGVRVTKWALTNLDKLTSHIDDHQLWVQMHYLCLRPTVATAKDALEVQVMVERLRKQPVEDHFDQGDLDMVFTNKELTKLDLRRAATETNPDMRRQRLRELFVRQHGIMPELLNGLREMIRCDALAEEKTGLENTLKYLLGGLGVDKNTYVELSQLYDKFHIETHQAVMNAEVRAGMLSKFFDEMGLVKVMDKILELGAGSGGLVKALNKFGWRTVGIDFNRGNAMRGTDEGAGIVEWADWRELPYENKEFAAIISMGRSLTHTETVGDLVKVFTHAASKLKDDGLFVYDADDPDYGTRGESRARYQNFVQNELGVDVPKFCYIVDSPDGKEFYNRLMLSEERHLKAMLSAGLVPMQVIREDIPGGGGNVNMVFAARKMSDDERKGQYKPNYKEWMEEIMAKVARLDETKSARSLR